MKIDLIALFSWQMDIKPLLIELHFLPCLEYFCLLLHHKEVYLEVHESYVKGSYRNKARIVTSNGVQTLSIPLQKGKHQQKNIQEVQIAETTQWRRQHWRSLKTAYQSAAYWDDYAPEVEALLQDKSDKLWGYNLQLIKGLIDILQLDIDLKLTDSYAQETTDSQDLRQKVLPKNKDWHTPSIQTVAYEQVFQDRQAFVMNTSILDLLFCKGPESSLILENMITFS